MEIDLQSIVTVLVGLLGGGTIAGIMNAYLSRKKFSAEAANINIKGEISLTETALSIAESLRSDIRSLHTDMEDMRQKHKELNHRIDDLLEENRSLKNKISHLESENQTLKEAMKGLEDKLPNKVKKLLK